MSDDFYEDDFTDASSVRPWQQQEDRSPPELSDDTPSTAVTAYEQQAHKQAPAPQLYAHSTNTAASPALTHDRPTNNLESSFDSYDDGDEDDNVAAVLLSAASARELSSSHSSAFSGASQHSDPMFPTEAAKPAKHAKASPKKQQQAYPTEASAAHVPVYSTTTSSRTSPSPSRPSRPTHQQQPPPQHHVTPPYTSEAFVTRATAGSDSDSNSSSSSSSFSFGDGPDGHVEVIGTNHRRNADEVSGEGHRDNTKSFQDTTDRDDTGWRAEGNAAHIPSATSVPHARVSPPRSVPSQDTSNVSAPGAHWQTNTSMSVSPADTAAAAMIATPNTRDISGARQTGATQDDGNQNKKKALHQSNYTTVAELEDEPTGPHVRGQATSTQVEEVSEEGDEEEGRRDTDYDESHPSVHSDDRYREDYEAAAKDTTSSHKKRSAATSTAASSTPATPTYSDRFTYASASASAHYPSYHSPDRSVRSRLGGKASNVSHMSDEAELPRVPSQRAHSSSSTETSSEEAAQPRAEDDHGEEEKEEDKVGFIQRVPSAVPPYVRGGVLTPPQPHQHTPETTPTRTSSSRSSSSSSSSSSAERSQEDRHAEQDVGSENERAQLLLRITDLQVEVSSWDRRIERKRTLMAATAAVEATTPKVTRSPSISSARGAPTPSRAPAAGGGGAMRRGSGPARSPLAAAGRRAGSKGPPSQQQQKRPRGTSLQRPPRTSSKVPPVSRYPPSSSHQQPQSQQARPPPSKARLAALREENQKLEAKYARLTGGDGAVKTEGGGAAHSRKPSSSMPALSVPAFIARAEAQLQMARLRLTEVTAARRALENRDKRAAHTIEEVHRRMPTEDELQERQMNEGIYARVGLEQTMKELKATIERTRAASQLMETKCAELTEQARQRRLTTLTPKEYETLRDLHETQKKTMEKHKTAIAVYSTAVAQEVRSGGVGRTSGATSLSTSPRKGVLSPKHPINGPTVTPEELQAVEAYETTSAAVLADEHTALVNRKQAVQHRINELWRRIQQRSEQIKANEKYGGYGSIGMLVPAYEVPGTTASTMTTHPAAGGGAAVAHRSSLRDVLQTPAGLRHKAPAASTASPSADTSPKSGQRSRSSSSVAAERLRGAVAAARQSNRGRPSVESAAPPVVAPSSSSSPSVSSSPALSQASPSPLQQRQHRQHAPPLPASPPPPTASASIAQPPEEKPIAPALAELLDAPVPAPPRAGPAAGAVAAGDRYTSSTKASSSTAGAASASSSSLPRQAQKSSEEKAEDDDEDIEALLRKMDAENKRLGQEMFGHAAPAGAGAAASAHAARPPPPLNPWDVDPSQATAEEEEEEEAGRGHDPYRMDSHASYKPSLEPQQPPPHAGSRFDDEEMDEISEEELAPAAEGSGRSTPDWLREI